MGRVGLRVDVCTYQGLRQGVRPLLEALGRRKIRSTIFPSMGPDRSGLAVLRVFRKKGFLGKMLRTRAVRMYGFRTMLYGTLLPSPRLAARCGETLRRAAGEGHELGVHAWDHVRWQDRLDSLSAETIREDYERAIEAFERAVGRLPECTAAPAWLASEASLLAEERCGFRYASDVRGRGPFRPVVSGRVLAVPQIPITLPTLDEVLGRGGATAETFNDQVIRGLAPDAANVLCVHAESEGRAHLRSFEALIDRAIADGWRFVPLHELLPADPAAIPGRPVERGFVPGRAGAVSVEGGSRGST